MNFVWFRDYELIMSVSFSVHGILKCAALTLILITGTGVASEETQLELRVWESKAGTKVQASLVFADHSEVKLKTQSGKIISLHPDKLSKDDQNYILSKFPLPPIAKYLSGKRILFHVQDWPVTAVFQFDEDGNFKYGSLKDGKIRTEKNGLKYKIKNLEIKLMDGEKVFSRLIFPSAAPKVGDRLSFGLSRTMVSGAIISIADAASFQGM